jgi:hypothetical protein
MMTPTPRQKRTRANDATIAARVEEVLHLRLNGALLYDLKAHAVEKQWNVSERQLRRYCEAADVILAEAIDNDRDKLLRRHIAQRHGLFARALSDGDYRTALAVLKDEGELLSLYPAKRLEMTGKEGGPLHHEHTFSDKERADAILAILARSSGSPGEVATGGAGGNRPDSDTPGDSAGQALADAGSDPDASRDDAGPVADEPTPLFGQ